MANTHVSAAANSGSDSAAKTTVASDVKQVDVDEHTKNSSFQPSTHTSIHENSVFQRLANGACYMTELRNQLTITDADNAIGIFCQLKWIRILVKRSDKEMSDAFVLAEDKRDVAADQPNTDERTASRQPSEFKITEIEDSELLSDKSKSYMESAQAEDKHDGCSSCVSADQPNTVEHTTSRQSSEMKINGAEDSQLLLDKSNSCVESAQVNEKVATAPLNAEHTFATTTPTLEFHANQCQIYMKHLCNKRYECSVRHDSLPYLWRVQYCGKWVAFDDSVGIEQAFCIPDNSTYPASCQVCIYLCNRSITF